MNPFFCILEDMADFNENLFWKASLEGWWKSEFLSYGWSLNLGTLSLSQYPWRYLRPTINRKKIFSAPFQPVLGTAAKPQGSLWFLVPRWSFKAWNSIGVDPISFKHRVWWTIHLQQQMQKFAGHLIDSEATTPCLAVLRCKRLWHNNSKHSTTW